MPAKSLSTNLAVAIFFAGALPSLAGRLTGDDVVTVTPADAFVFSSEDLTANDVDPGAAVVIETPPRFGSLVVDDGELTYRPSETFWRHGADLFVYRPATLAAGSEAATVVLLAGRFGRDGLRDGFEESTLGDPWLLLGDPQAVYPCATHATRGLQGLCLDQPAGFTALELVDPDRGGRSQTGGGVTIILQPPSVPPEDPQDPRTFPIGYPFLRLGEEGEVTLSMRREGDLVEVRGEARSVHGAVTDATPWVPLAGAVHRLELAWPAASSAVPAALMINGAPVASFTVVPPRQEMLALWADERSALPAAFDEVVIRRYDPREPGPGSPFALLAVDGFEDGTLAGWSRQRGALVTAEGALAGGGGLVLDCAVASIEQDLAAAVQNLRVQWTQDLDDASLLPGTALLLFATQRSQRHLKAPLELTVHGLGGSQAIVMTVTDDAGVAHPSAPVVPGPGPHTLTVSWRAATADLPGVGQLWIDGALAAEIAGVDSHGSEVAAFGFGGRSLAGSGQPSGTMAIDDVVAWAEE